MGMDIYGANPIPLKGKEAQGNAALEAYVIMKEKIGESFNELHEDQKKAVLELETIVDNYNPGKYFRANLWSWRPIHMLCETIIREKDLKIPTDGWGENSGYGIEEQKKCDRLAKEIDIFLDMLETALLVSPEQKVEDLRLYINMMVLNDDYSKPYGICYTDGKFVAAQDWTESTAKEYKKYLNGKAITHSLLPSEFRLKDSGKAIYSSYSVSYTHIKKFSTFLKHCGGFNIY